MKIYLGADHKGFYLKEHLKVFLKNENIEFSDLGGFTLDPKDDYPIIAEKVAKHVAAISDSLGILICGSGIGVEVAANKFHGIRAGICSSVGQAVAARNDDSINVLVLASNFIKEHDAKEIIKAFIETPFDEASRHKRRLEEIQKIEENN